MPLPRAVTADSDPCALSSEWKVDQRVTVLLVLLIRLMARDPRLIGIVTGLRIISGFRTIAEQIELAQQGRPAADPQLSTHTTCPATGVDLRLNDHMDPENDIGDRGLWLAVGEIAESIGLRWGGGSANATWWRPQDAPRIAGTRVRDYYPSDFNHFDLGPRKPPKNT